MLYLIKFIFNSIRILILFIFYSLITFILLIYVKLFKKKSIIPKIIFGTEPLINFKYWNEAIKHKYSSTTLMSTYYKGMNKFEDFDLYYESFLPFYNNKYLNKIYTLTYLKDFIPFFKTIIKYDIVCASMMGYALWRTPFKYFEAKILKSLNIKTIIIPFGGDIYETATIDPSFRHGMLSHFRQHSIFVQKEISRQKKYWILQADILIPGFQIENVSRWDILPFSFISIDIFQWNKKINYNNSNGENETVFLTHSPNHRIIKGTEYIINAIDELKNEGYKIELILIEKKSNDEVKKILQEVSDIHIEQLIGIGHGLNGVESMACGLPTLFNLDNKYYTDVFRRYSFLNECPALSTTPETIKENLRLLITNPDLRKELGEASRAYVEKYHSYKTTEYVFEKIIDKILYNKDVDLINLFHPLMPESYNNLSPKIVHPLVENKIPHNYKFN